MNGFILETLCKSLMRRKNQRTIWGRRKTVPYAPMANLRTKILDFRGFDSSRILSLRGGILMSIGGFLDLLGRQILIG